MADVSKINGFDIKDVQARSDIANLTNNVGDLSTSLGTLETNVNKDINGLKDDINENVESIKNVENNISNINNEINLQNFITHDLSASGYIQGMAIDNNLMYVYQETNFPNGDLLVYDIDTMKYVKTISNLKLYHANDMTIINNKMYVCACKSADTTATNKSICVVDLTNNSVTEINPFNNLPYLQMWGLTKISDTELLCSLSNNTVLGEIGLDEDAFYIYNIESGVITELEVSNPKNINFNSIYAKQSMEYVNGKLYILTSLHNTIIECYVDVVENTLKFSKLYNLPSVDHLGMLIEEYEGISLINNSNFANNSIMITTKLNCTDSTEVIMKSYIINLDSNITYYHKQIVPSGYGYNYRQLIYVNNTAPTLYEDGTSNYPIKTLERAIQVNNYNHKVHNSFGDIYISGGNNYTVSIIFEQGGDVVINNGSGANVSLKLSKITNSKVYVAGGTNGITLTGDSSKIEISNSIVRFKNVAFNCSLIIKNFSDVRTQDCTSTIASTGKVISVADYSIYMNGITSFKATGTYLAECMSGSSFHHNTTHIATAKIQKVSACNLVQITN